MSSVEGAETAHSESSNDDAARIAGAPVVNKTAAAGSEVVTAGEAESAVVVRDADSHDVAPPAMGGAKAEPDPAAASHVGALREEVESLKKMLADAKLAAGDAAELGVKIDSLTEKVDQQRASARDRVLGTMGVKQHLRKYAPEVDVDTEDGLSELQKWAEEHPEMLAGQPQSNEESFSPEELTKKFKSPHLINVSMLRGRK